MRSSTRIMLPSLALLAVGAVHAADCCQGNRVGKSPLITPGADHRRALDGQGDVDLAHFVVTEPSLLRLATSGQGDGNTALQLYGPDDQSRLVASNDDESESSHWSLIERDAAHALQPGTYHVVVRDAGSTAIPEYRIELSLTPLASVARAAAPVAATADRIRPPRQLLPDLKPIADAENGYLYGWTLDQVSFPGNTILRLSTALANVGEGPLEFRGSTVNSDGTQDVVQRIYSSDGTYTDRVAGVFRYHPLHHHVHLDNVALYNLRAVGPRQTVGSVVRGGAKTSFCMEDVISYDLALPGAPQEQIYLECTTFQGISVGWNDLYVKTLPDQWIDVTNVPDGKYWLEVVADPLNILKEVSDSNNTTRILIDLHVPRGAITGTVIDDGNGNGVRDGNDVGALGQVVYLDLNGNGVRDSGVANLTSSDVPKLLNDHARNSSDLLVDGVQGRISDIDVVVTITHPNVADLDLVLISPTGRKIALASQLATGVNLSGTVFDDQAVTSVRIGSAPFSGHFKPVGALADLNGGSPNGRWQLEIGTRSGGASGTLVSWSMAMGITEPAVRSGADGRYAFNDLPVLPYRVRVEPSAGWRATAPITGVYPVTMSDGLVAEGRDFAVTSSTLIAGQVYHDLDGDGVKESGEGGISGVRVWLDLDNDGAFDAGPATIASIDVPKILPDLGQAGSVITIAGRSGYISKLRVRLSMKHDYVPDVSLWLSGPDGTRIQLVEHVDWEGKDFANAVLDDDATHPVREAHPPVTGSFRPEQSLAAFIGKSLNGTWTLEMQDNEQLDAGTLTAWSLIVDYSEPTVITDAGGSYAFTDQPAGTYTVRHQVPSGYVGIAPLSGKRVVTVAAGQAVTNCDFADAHGGTISGGVIEAGAAGSGCCGDGGGLANWTVWLDLDQDGVKDAGEPSVISAADGSFSFTTLKPGTYRVREVVNAGWTLVGPTSGFRLVTVVSGQLASGICFSNRR